MVHCRRVIDRIGLATPIPANMVGDVRQINKVFGHIGSRISNPSAGKWTLHEITVSLRHGGELVASSLELLEMEFRQLRFRIESINMAGTALHGQENARLGLGFQHWRFRLKC